MDSKLKADWIAALRSGEFKQTRNVMRDDTGYCCLGVLCLLAREYFDSFDGMPSEAALESVRLSPRHAGHLAKMNDGSGRFKRPRTFPQIADWLESNPDV